MQNDNICRTGEGLTRRGEGRRNTYKAWLFNGRLRELNISIMFQSKFGLKWWN